jgi:SAM-dependent methyltransferase
MITMKTQRKTEWFEDDALWRAMTPLLFSQKRAGNPAEQVLKALKLVKPRGKDILDLCCGPGRWSVPLAQRGFRVTGVDRTKYFLKRARAKARSAKVRIAWVRQDMRDFVRPGAFDVALSTFTSFGYFDDKGEDLLVLRNIFTSLRPGGSLLMEMAGKEILARIYQPTTSSQLPDGSVLFERHEVSDGWSRMRNEWTFVKDGKARTWRFHVTIYSGQELRDRLEQAGFAGVKLFGSFDGEEYGANAQRLIVVGRKPDAPKPAR